VQREEICREKVEAEFELERLAGTGGRRHRSPTIRDAFRYTVKVIVTAVGDDKVTGHIEALFDTDTSDWITAGDKNTYVGKEEPFEPRFMHEVIKRDAHQPLAPHIECR